MKASHTETVAIVGGTGQLGYGLALRLAEAGCDIALGSRERARAQQAAARVFDAVPNASVAFGTNEEAAAMADRLVVVAVPYPSLAAMVSSIAPVLREGQVVLDTTVPLSTGVGGRPVHLLGVWQGSAAQQTRSGVPSGVGVVSGLHTVSAAKLANLDVALDEDTLVCGDVSDDKALVREIIGRVKGLNVIDAGRLEMSRYTESLTPLIIGINVRHRSHAGVRFVGLGAL